MRITMQYQIINRNYDVQQLNIVISRDRCQNILRMLGATMAPCNLIQAPLAVKNVEKCIDFQYSSNNFLGCTLNANFMRETPSNVLTKFEL